jgi:UPF0755 protein
MTERPNSGHQQARDIIASRWIIRLAAFGLVICLCSAALFVLIGQWQALQLKSLPQYEEIKSNLNPVQKLYLGIALASRSEELSQSIGSGTAEVLFEISFGETAEQIAVNLNDADLLNDTDLFLNYLRYYGLDSFLEAGSFHIDPQITYPQLAERLTNATIEDVELRFIEGWRIEEMANYLEAVQPAEIDPTDFLNIVINQDLTDLSSYEYLSSLPESATLEGFLFPDTYRISVKDSAEDLVRIMLDNFDEKLSPATRQAIGAQGLTIFEAVTLASVIQRESVIASESPAIASVFLNRLRDGIKLQADPTVQYALGYQQSSESWWKSPLSSEDLEISSPYNTYVVHGLPAGPISNPGLSYLEAVAAPLASDYYFFVADCEAEVPGSHIFSKTYDEHLFYVERCR